MREISFRLLGVLSALTGGYALGLLVMVTRGPADPDRASTPVAGTGVLPAAAGFAIPLTAAGVAIAILGGRARGRQAVGALMALQAIALVAGVIVLAPLLFVPAGLTLVLLAVLARDGAAPRTASTS